MIDTLLLARRKYPGGANRLDDLCVRYRIDNSNRTKHGALLDAELLAEVYVELIEARQASLVLVETAETGELRQGAAAVRQRPTPLPPRLTPAERDAHRAFVKTLGNAAIWLSYLMRRPRRKRHSAGRFKRFEDPGISALHHRRRLPRLRLHVADLLPVQADEIHRIEHQRREAAVADRIGDDFAGEWE